MLRDIHNIQNFNTVHDKNEMPKSWASNSHNIKKRTVLSASNSMVIIKSNVSPGKSCGVTNNNSSKSKSTIVKDPGKAGQEKFQSEYKYDGSSRLSPLSNNCQDSTLQRPSQGMEAFNLFVKETKQTDDHQERNVIDTPTKRQCPSSNKDSEFQPDTKKPSVFSEWNQKAESCQKIISTEPNSVFLPKVTSEEIFSEEFDKVINEINEQFKENLHSVLFEPDNEASLQSTIEKCHQLGNLEQRTDFRGDSAVSKCANKTPIFKTPEIPTRRRRKSLRAKTISESANKPKKMKKLEDSKRKVDKKVNLQQRQSRDKIWESDSSLNTILINENGLNTVPGNKLGANILCKFPNPSKFCFSHPFLESDPAERFPSDIRDSSRPQNNAGDLSQSRNDTADISGSRNDTGEISRNDGDSSRNDSSDRSRNDTGDRSRNDTGDRSRNDTGDRSRNDTGDRSRNDTEERSQFRNDTVTEKAIPSRNDSQEVHLSEVSFLLNPRQDYLNSQISRIENFISNGLVLLENHIHSWHCISCAIPPWSPKLVSVLHNLARHRSQTVRDYLTACYNSDRRHPLSEIRGRFVEILEAIGYGMIEILDDLQYILSDGNISEYQLMIPKIMNFWEKIEKDYMDLCQQFYSIREDYHNFYEVWASMGGDYIIVKEIFFTFQECIINL